MNVKDTAQKILKEVGGPENVQNLTHCVTRLRFNLKSMEHVDEGRIKNISGVVGVVNKGGQFQVIIGPDVAMVYGELLKLGDFQTSAPVQADAADEEEEKKGLVNRILDTLAGIFSPIMPIIAGAGMVKALLSILTLFHLIDSTGNLYYFLSFIADASYYFLPIFLAASASRKFQCNMQMAMLMGAILLHPKLIALKETADMVSVIGIPVRMVTYSASVIPIILIVFTLSYVEKFVEKITPSLIKFIAKPLLTILIMAPVSLVVLGPLGGFIGDGLVGVLLSIEKIAPWILPTVIGAFMPFLVMTGMHYSLLPAYVNSLSALGYETIIGPGNLPSNIAQGAAALCVAVKTKNKEFKQLSVSSGITALLGVTEPALFGVNLRLKKPLIATTIGGGLGGLYAGLTGVRRFGGGGAGLAAIGLYVGDDSRNVTNALIAAAISFAVTFLIQWKIGFADVPSDEDGQAAEKSSINAPKNGNTVSENAASQNTSNQSTSNQSTSNQDADPIIYSPLKGEMVPLSKVNDPVFSSGMLGSGMAVKPSEGKLYAPVSGTIATISDTLHAVGLKADNGAELLIHTGIDTVELKGKYYKAYKKTGDTVKKGDLILEFDCKAIEQCGYDTITPILVSGTGQYEKVAAAEAGHVEVGDKILTLS